MQDIVIVSASRTAVGSYGGTLKTTPVMDLGAVTLKETLKKAGVRPVVTDECIKFGADAIRDEGMIALEKEYHDYDDTLQPVMIDQVIMGNVVGAGQGQNVTRQAMIKAGIPKETCATTVNKICASGMEAVALAFQALRSGDSQVVLAGGMENMSMIPYVLPTTRWGQRMGDGQIVDIMVHDGLFEIFYGYHMGITAENIAEKYGITRQEQDELGALSHQRAMKAIQDGLFKQEIVSVVIPQRKGDPAVFDTDERPMETSLEKMSKLRPAFKKDGTVTAGNASGINDGAASLLMMTQEKASEYGLTPIVKIRAHASAGLDPAYMGLGPVPAVRKILDKENLNMGDFDRIELNEAFASQAIACARELECDMEKTNVLGSGISIGHPIGCSGARILVTLIGQLQNQGLDMGLASLCIGGGQGMAMVVENAS
jgi:acetyl-CoA C-acetyltransferase